MDPNIARIISSLKSFDDVSQFETNARTRNAFDVNVERALNERAAALGRNVVAQETGLDLTQLSPAEEEIVRAAAVYASIKKRKGTNANRMFDQFRRIGLIASAERSVMKSQPTIGFETLAAENLDSLSYEKIIIDHPDEFSDRAMWYARKRLGLANASERPPTESNTPVQRRTEALLEWLRSLSDANDGIMRAYSNAEAAAALGMEDMHKYGRVQGNIQSRLDFACYRANLPALGLTAAAPFADAWQDSQGRDWNFPTPVMQNAARAHRWSAGDYQRILNETQRLPGQAYLVWKNELAASEPRVRAWAFTESFDSALDFAPTSTQRNPAWTRDELILALDLYLRSRQSPFSKTSDEVTELSRFLGLMALASGRTEANTFRNPDGVYMKMMNFRRFDPQYVGGGKVGLERGNKLEGPVWSEFEDKPTALAGAVADIRARFQPDGSPGTPYWMFVCNPRKRAIDSFLEKQIEHDTWGIRPADRSRFAPGQLGLVRVGMDRRPMDERNGKPPLEAGIYALCEVESEAFPGTGANDEYWTEGGDREPGWPTVRIRYLRTYLGSPLTINALKKQAPDISPLILDGLQAASFPIRSQDFHRIIGLLGEDIDEVVARTGEQDATKVDLAALEKKYGNASPEVKERVSKFIERGPIGHRIKKALGHRCQVCSALGRAPIAFKKKNGEPYAEAHHVMPVSELKVGSLGPSNIMVVCANHHRQLHYGAIEMEIQDKTFEMTIDGTGVSIERYLGENLI
jgi:predicted HNH restriction endonuclease